MTGPPGRRRTPSRLVRALALALGLALAVGPAAPAHAVPARPAAEAAGDPARADTVVCGSELHPALAKRLGARIASVVGSRDGAVAVGVSAFGGDLLCGYRATREFDAASVGKVVVLGALLRTTMDQGRPLTREEHRLATAMITVSDNDATVRLRDELGRARIQRFLDRAGLTRTRLDPGDAVGLMRITALDQLRLLRTLTEGDGVLGAPQRGYARRLMASVAEDQRWGVPAGAPPGARVYVKNGWLPHGDTDVWRVNSVGAFDGTPAGPYRLVVLTDGNAGMRYGIDTVQAVARTVHTTLNTPDAPELGATRPRSADQAR
ncbi:serine hydrolase [Marinitenerispora sediminis]|uniref:serine hydrolase n=1 Tax=Marinitenerispora sediminis TaxID=1931232 RepID=UPI001F216FB1|nr:serine hydrolase [Marinitenerispora sediminis]